MGSWFLLFLFFIPFLTGMLMGIFKPKDKMMKIISYFSVILTSILVWISIFVVKEEAFVILKIVEKYQITLRFDNAGKIFAGMVSLLWPLALMYSYGYMKHDERRNIYNNFYVMTYGVVLGLCVSENLLTMFIFYEMLTFITLPLIIHPMTSEAKRAGRIYLYYSLSGSSLSLVGMIMMTTSLGTNSFNLAFAMSQNSSVLYQIGFVLCFFGFGVKSAIFPLHYWLPTAGVAPTPTTALLHAVAVVKAGVFALIRITYYLNGACMLQGTWIQYLMMMISSFTILFGSIKALKEQHLKRRFAYSTISNLSYIVLAISFMSKLGLVAAFLHLVIHSITKICLFFCCGEIIENSSAKYVYELNGIGKKMPLTMISFALASCSITGVPLFGGFVSKYYLIKAGLSLANVFSYIGVICLIISALLTAIYSLVIPFISFVNSPSENNQEIISKANEKSKEMLIPIITFSVCTLILGVCSSYLVSLFMNMFM